MIIWLVPTDACGQVLLPPVHCCCPRARPLVGAPTSLNEQPVDSRASLVSPTARTWVVSGEGAGLGGGTLIETWSSCLGRELPRARPASRRSYFSSRKQEVSHGPRRPAGRLAPRVRLMSSWTEGPSLSPGKQEGGLEEEDRRRDPLSSKIGSPVGPQRKAGMRSVWIRPPSPLSGHTWPVGQEWPHAQTLQPS